MNPFNEIKEAKELADNGIKNIIKAFENATHEVYNDNGIENSENEKNYDAEDKESEKYTSYDDRINHTPRENSELGEWKGKRGESEFVPNSDSEAGSTVKDKLAQYGMDGVEYKDAEPDFSQCCEAEVKIDNMTENREKNFAQADAECAKMWNESGREGKNDWTAADVRDWRRENQYSWHECCDTTTMQLVDRDIHETFRHSGGVAECKARDAADNNGDGGGFDE